MVGPDIPAPFHWYQKESADVPVLFPHRRESIHFQKHGIPNYAGMMARFHLVSPLHAKASLSLQKNIPNFHDAFFMMTSNQRAMSGIVSGQITLVLVGGISVSLPVNRLRTGAIAIKRFLADARALLTADLYTEVFGKFTMVSDATRRLLFVNAMKSK